jgi:dihydroorotate dehydrogenase|tara:strand:+ start:339 stop:1262 length:924 start_codon:yes stop_codon:yes gene_type:complete
LALEGLKVITYLGFKIKNNNPTSVSFLGIDLDNTLGLAAGLDKNGDYIDSLSALGFGHIEIGTVTPKPQLGNKKPRLFRIRSEKALINNMGFNNKGVDYLVRKVEKRNSSTPLGISIGKNLDTPMDSALEDYLICLDKVYLLADYIAINISSPNTKNLRDLQSETYIDNLLSSIKDRQSVLNSTKGYTPILIKISPDMSLDELKIVSASVLQNKLDGIICANTTSSHNHPSGKGGLSGGPLFELSTNALAVLRGFVGPDLPIIASGGVIDLETFEEKINKGANVAQIYTGFIYEGPSLVDEIINSVS